MTNKDSRPSHLKRSFHFALPMLLACWIIFLKPLSPEAIGSIGTATETEPDRKKVIENIRIFADSSSASWIANYEWLLIIEQRFFARDTFTMAWKFSDKSLKIEADSTPGFPWKVTYNPEFPGQKHHPVTGIYNLNAYHCLPDSKQKLWLEDINFEFFLDSSLHVKHFRPCIMYSRNGYQWRMKFEDWLGFEIKDCVKLNLSIEEAKKQNLVGRNFRSRQALLGSCKKQKERIREMTLEAVREHYPGFKVTSVEIGTDPYRQSYFDPSIANNTVKTYGIIHASKGPAELTFEARIVMGETEVEKVVIINIQK